MTIAFDLGHKATKQTNKQNLLNIDNPYTAQMVRQIYPTDLQLNKTNPSDTEAPFFGLQILKPPFLDLDLSIRNGIVSNKTYGKQNDFYFEIFNFPFLDGDVPMVYTFRSLFVLQEYILKLTTSTKETHI